MKIDLSEEFSKEELEFILSIFDDWWATFAMLVYPTDGLETLEELFRKLRNIKEEMEEKG